MQLGMWLVHASAAGSAGHAALALLLGLEGLAMQARFEGLWGAFKRLQDMLVGTGNAPAN